MEAQIDNFAFFDLETALALASGEAPCIFILMLKIVFLKRKKRDSLFRDSSVPIATESTVKCYMEIEIGPAENVVKRGRIELTVFDTVCPKTSENFRRLCCNDCRLGGLLA